MTVVDQQARDMARTASFEAKQALNAIAAHEKECATSRQAAQQWRDTTSKTLDAMKTDAREEADKMRSEFTAAMSPLSEAVGGLYRRAWWAAGGMMASMFAVILLLVGVLVKHSG